MNDATHHFAHEAFVTIPDATEQERMVEAVLFASSEPLSQLEIAGRLPAGCDVGEAILALRRRYEGRGVQLMRLGDAWAFRTASDLGFLMSRQVVEHRKLSRAAIETLAIVAYHQPVTRAEIEEIRGVSVSKGTIDLLMELGWIKLGRRKQTPGRPVTLVVTPAFLDHFGLESEGDLPGLAELRASGLLDNRPLPGGLPGLAVADDASDDEDDATLDDADDLLV
jgi:segregation and condensation protein B